MTVLKKFEPRLAEIAQLEWLLDQLTPEQDDIKRKAMVDLKRVKGGDRGKFNASQFVETLYADRNDVVILHDLRLVKDEQSSQVDHLVVEGDGRVTLFETKNFTNGLKVSDEGDFAYWNRFKRSFYSINSPLENAEKNKQNLRDALTQFLGKTPTFHHFILVDYRAKLIKPETGFEMIERSDKIKSRLEKNNSAAKGGFFGSIKRMFGMGDSLSVGQLTSRLAPLINEHQPLAFNYIEKYGLDLVYEPSKAEASIKPENYQPEPKMQRLTLAKMAREMTIHPQELQARLVEQGLLEKRGFKTFVSDKGRESGIQFRKGQRGIFFLIPTAMGQDPALQVPAQPVEAPDTTAQ